MAHLTPKQFEDYCLRQLQAAELLSVSDHLGECDACRGRVEAAMNGDAAFFALRAGIFGEAAAASSPHAARAHLTAEQTAEYVDGGLSGGDLQTAADHLSNCGQCAAAVDDLRVFKNQIAPSLEDEYHPATVPSPAEGLWRRAIGSLPALFRVPARPAFASALALVLLAVSGWLVWRASRERGSRQEVVVSPTPQSQPAPIVASPTPTSQPTPAPSEGAPAPPQPAPAQPRPATAPEAVVAQLNDGGGRLTLDREGRLSGADALPPDYRVMLKRALATRRIERSTQLDGLTRPPSSLMSSDGRAGEFSVLEPVGNVLLSARPTFRWSPMEGATAYVVEVYDDKFNLLAASPQLTEHAWALPQTLTRGRLYAWQVKAVKDGQEFKSPRPPAPQARFRVLDQARADELAKARRAYPSSHLTLGLLYAEAGLLSEAERELRLLQKANPNSDVARGLLRQLRALRRRSQ